MHPKFEVKNKLIMFSYKLYFSFFIPKFEECVR